MSISAETADFTDAAPAALRSGARSLPVSAVAAAAGATSIVIGLLWDISWHRSIGRDTFWTPAHMAIYFGGLLASAGVAPLILRATFREGPERSASVRIGPFRGPLGAWMMLWGAAAMVASAPFDNWWHDAYGLDVTILSPPHTVLVLGILGVSVGGVLIVVAALNRASGELRDRLAWILLAIGAEILVLVMTAIFEYTFRANLHSGRSYRAIAIVAPLTLIALAKASDRRWGATAVAAGYTLFMAGMLWLLARVPAQPKLGPVYQTITHFVPLYFPVLLLVPALAIDVVRGRSTGWGRWPQAIVLGGVFLATLIAAEWPFASFLQSDASHNWVFGTHYHPYFMPPASLEVRGEFISPPAFVFWTAMAEAVVAAVVTSWIGLALGDALRKVRR